MMALHDPQSERSRKRTKQGIYISDISYERVSSLFHLSTEDACKELGLGITSFKKLCRRYGIIRWPYRTNKKFQRAGMDHPESDDCNECSSGDAPYHHHSRVPQLARSPSISTPQATGLDQLADAAIAELWEAPNAAPTPYDRRPSGSACSGCGSPLGAPAPQQRGVHSSSHQYGSALPQGAGLGGSEQVATPPSAPQQQLGLQAFAPQQQQLPAASATWLGDGGGAPWGGPQHVDMPPPPPLFEDLCMLPPDPDLFLAAAAPPHRPAPAPSQQQRLLQGLAKLMTGPLARAAAGQGSAGGYLPANGGSTHALLAVRAALRAATQQQRSCTQAGLAAGGWAAPGVATPAGSWQQLDQQQQQACAARATQGLAHHAAVPSAFQPCHPEPWYGREAGPAPHAEHAEHIQMLRQLLAQREQAAAAMAAATEPSMLRMCDPAALHRHVMAAVAAASQLQ